MTIFIKGPLNIACLLNKISYRGWAPPLDTTKDFRSPDSSCVQYDFFKLRVF